MAWRASFSDSSGGLSLLQPFQPILPSSRQLGSSQSSLQLIWSKDDSQRSFYVLLGRVGPSESSLFQGLPEANLNCLLLVYISIPVGGTLSVLKETTIQRKPRRAASQAKLRVLRLIRRALSYVQERNPKLSKGDQTVCIIQIGPIGTTCQSLPQFYQIV